jgi:hypothetical protein
VNHSFARITGNEKPALQPPKAFARFLALLAIEELISTGIGEHREWAFECRRAGSTDCGKEQRGKQ